MPPSKRAKRTELAGPLASEPDAPVPPASAADAPVPPEPGAASPPAPSTGEDTILKKKKEPVVQCAHWNSIELAVRALPHSCVVQCSPADTVLLICLSVHRPPLVRGATRASGISSVPRLTASVKLRSRTRASSRRSAAPMEEAAASTAISTPSPPTSGHRLREATGISRSPARCARPGRSPS